MMNREQSLGHIGRRLFASFDWHNRLTLTALIESTLYDAIVVSYITRTGLDSFGNIRGCSIQATQPHLLSYYPNSVCDCVWERS